MAHGKSLQLRNITRPAPRAFFIPSGEVQIQGKWLVAPPQYASVERRERKRQQEAERRAARARRQAQGR